ncbi:MAG: hypothetical protein EHM46_04895, partial [Bacteroidetes bacterium]
ENTEKNHPSPEDCRLATEIAWPGDPGGTSPAYHPVDDPGISGAADLIITSAGLEEMPVDIIALGPLTNLAEVINYRSGFPAMIRMVYWNGDPNIYTLNAQFDPGAIHTILESPLRITMVQSGRSVPVVPGGAMAGFPDPVTRYAKAVRDFYNTNARLLKGKAMAGFAGDDCIPLYMLYPEIFTSGRSVDGQEVPGSKTISPGSAADIRSLVWEVLESDLEDKSIIFARFPVDPGLFEPDVAAIAGEVIRRHGLKEWKIVVLTNEFHEHLGAYSILGAKMGLRAREYFHVGIDELVIQSLAGSVPPVSCLNDGLQVSTGGTMGHGTITLAEGEMIPSARFKFKDRTLELTIRPEIRDRIRNDVESGVKAYGLETPEYWAYIRGLALQYWKDLSRFEVFEIREQKPVI